MTTPPKISLVLDSGAFSSWTRGAEVDLDAYIRYIKDNCEWLDHYVNLDVIPGEFGRVPSLKEVEASAQKGWENLLYMESFGLHPMPVFHQGEQFKWLHRLIDHGCTYIGISPANDRTTDQKRVWLDQVFEQITDSEGWPTIKTHGFGVTSIPILFRYPWYSADSTSWTLFGVYGMVLMPQVVDGAFMYDRSPWVITVSDKSFRSMAEGKHFRQFPKASQDVIQQYLLHHCDVTLEEAEAHSDARARVNAIFYRDVSAKMPRLPFKPKQRRLF